MSKHTNPWTPSAERLRLLLDPRDPADDTMVTWLAIHAAQAGHLDRLADMLHRTLTRVMKDAGAVARQECLMAIQSIIDELDGEVEPATSGAVVDSLLDADTDLDQLEADQREGDRRRGGDGDLSNGV